MDGTFKYWYKGTPVFPGSGVSGFDYWHKGRPYVVDSGEGTAAVPGPKSIQLESLTAEEVRLESKVAAEFSVESIINDEVLL